jgi:HJR/Mrr/RecB family endonuclease
MTSSESAAFDAKDYDKFNTLADAYNTENGYGYGKTGKYGKYGYRQTKKRKRSMLK